MTYEKLHEIELQTVTNRLQIEQIVEKIDSHFQNTKVQHEKIFQKLEAMPNEDRIMRLFTQEGEKLAKGLIKRDDDQEKKINDISNEITGAKKGLKWAYGIITAIGGILGIKYFT